MFLYLFNVFAALILNENIYITLKNKHVALSHGKKVVTASLKAIKSSSAYSDKIKIEYNEGKYSIEIGHRYLCSGKGTNTLNVCKTLTNDNAVSIVQIKECYKILNNQKSCATNYTNGLFFEECTDSSNQCFDILRVENDPENSIRVPKEKFNESRRGIKPIKDYDMKYVIDAIDEAHHEIAEEDSSWIIKDKHFVPECFYGYKTVFSFLTDPLPNLTKLKQKYCMYNQMVNESLV